jgi:hypothetical protein
MNDPKATPGRDATLARAVERVRAQLSHFGKPKEPFGPMLFRQVLARLENEIERLREERDAAREERDKVIHAGWTAIALIAYAVAEGRGYRRAVDEAVSALAEALPMNPNPKERIDARVDEKNA